MSDQGEDAFVITRLCMIKPNPWKRSLYPSEEEKRTNLEIIARRLACMNSMTLLDRTSRLQAPMFRVKKKFKKKQFPFLPRNLHKAVMKWEVYEKRFNQWVESKKQNLKQEESSQKMFLLDDYDQENIHEHSKEIESINLRDKAIFSPLKEANLINLPVSNPEPESTLLNVSEILNKTSSSTKKRRSTSTFESSKKGRISLSRSGRVVKPPLANWAGQRIVYDVDGNPVEVHDIKTKTIFTEDAPKDEINHICREFGIETPPKPLYQQGRLSLPRRSLNRRSYKMVSRRLVPYSSSEDDHMSIDDVSLSPTENLSPTPIRPGRVYHYKGFSDIFKTNSDGETPIRFVKREEKKKPNKKLRKVHVDKKIKTENLASKTKVRRAKEKKTKPSRVKKMPPKRVPKKRKNAPRRDIISSDSDDLESIPDEMEEDDENASNHSRDSSIASVDYVVEQPPDTASENDSGSSRSAETRTPLIEANKPKQVLRTGRWNQKEKDILKIAFRALPPRSFDDDSRWQVYATQLKRTIEDVRQMAQTLQLIKENDDNVIESDEQPGPSRFEEEAVVSIMAKKGTATYAIQTERFTRKYMMNTKDDDGAEFFNKFGTPTNAGAVSTLMETALDDSLLDAWKTPEMTAKGQRKPFIPDIVNTIDRRSSILEIEEPSRYSNAAWTIDSAERQRQARRRHQIINETARGMSRVKFANSLSMNSTGFIQTSQVNSSIFNPDGTLNLPKFPNKKKVNRRTTLREEDEIDDEDADDEEEEEEY